MGWVAGWNCCCCSLVELRFAQRREANAQAEPQRPTPAPCPPAACTPLRRGWRCCPLGCGTTATGPTPPSPPPSCSGPPGTEVRRRRRCEELVVAAAAAAHCVARHARPPAPKQARPFCLLCTPLPPRSRPPRSQLLLPRLCQEAHGGAGGQGAREGRRRCRRRAGSPRWCRRQEGLVRRCRGHPPPAAPLCSQRLCWAASRFVFRCRPTAQPAAVQPQRSVRHCQRLPEPPGRCHPLPDHSTIGHSEIVWQMECCEHCV